jgi:hypothetical protein
MFHQSGAEQRFVLSDFYHLSPNIKKTSKSGCLRYSFRISIKWYQISRKNPSPRSLV